MQHDYIELGPWGAGMRSLRSFRPDLATKGARAKTYSAGLDQAEQLWLASQNVGPIASPLLLFYGLTQAGRALCAAGMKGPGWEAAEQHGLRFSLTKPRDGSSLDLQKVMVEPHGGGLVQQVAQLLGSPVLSRPTSFSEILASVDSHLYFDEEFHSAPRPLEVHENGDPSEAYGGPARKTLFIGHLPRALAVSGEISPNQSEASAYVRLEQPSPRQILEWLEAYPTLKALGMPSDVGSPEPSLDRDSKGEFSVRLSWGGNERVPGVTQTQWTIEHLDIVYSTDPNFSYGSVLPAVGGNQKAQRPLIAWWLVLYCLSMLSRYYPSIWTRLLDVDTSQMAVPFEHLISVARSKVPELLFEAVRAQRTE